MWWILYYEHGKKITYSLKTRDEATARFKKNEIENKIAYGDSPIPRKDTPIADCLKQFKEYRNGRLTDKTKSTDHYRIERFINDAKLNFLKEINETTVKRHLDERIKASISHRTANHTIRVLKTFLNFCIKQGYLGLNPLKNMPKYPIFETEQRFLTPEEIKSILELSKDMNIYPLILTAIYTGMRYGELANLRWEDIDFKNKIITVHKTKSKKFRKIPIHNQLKLALWKLRGTGECFKTKGFYWKMYRLMHKANKVGIKHFRFHDLRHTFASLLIKSGVDILTVSKLLGHSSVVVTQIYSHLYQDHIKDSIGRFRI